MASLEYLAGLFDGEGTFTVSQCRRISRGTHEYQATCLQVAISNTDKRLLQPVIDRWGPQVKLHSKQGPNYGNRKFCWTFQVQSNKAAQICRDLAPLLLSKREQAELLLFLDKVNKAPYPRGGTAHGQRRPDWKNFVADLVVEKVRELNKRGIDG